MPGPLSDQRSELVGAHVIEDRLVAGAELTVRIKVTAKTRSVTSAQQDAVRQIVAAAVAGASAQLEVLAPRRTSRKPGRN